MTPKLELVTALLFCGYVEGHEKQDGRRNVRHAISGEFQGNYSELACWAFVKGFLDGLGPGAASYQGPLYPVGSELGPWSSDRIITNKHNEEGAYRSGKARGSSAAVNRNVVELYPNRTVPRL